MMAGFGMRGELIPDQASSLPSNRMSRAGYEACSCCQWIAVVGFGVHACLMPSITHAVGNLAASVESCAGPCSPPRAGNVKKISSETRSLQALLDSLLPHAINRSISAVSLPRFQFCQRPLPYSNSQSCLPQLEPRRRSPTWRACWALVRAPAIVISFPWTCIDSHRLCWYL